MSENVYEAATIVVAHGDLPSLKEFHRILRHDRNGQGYEEKILVVRSFDVQGLFSSKFVRHESKVNMWLNPISHRGGLL